MIDLALDGIKDAAIRENFATLIDEFKAPIHNFEFQHFELVFTGAVTNYRFTHNMGFIPKDIIQTSVIGAGAVTFNYALFTATYLDITTTGASTVRFLAGNYSKNS